jgi:hypothetical protein
VAVTFLILEAFSRRVGSSAYTSAKFTGGTMGTVLVELGEQPKATEEQEQQKYHVAMARQ